MVAAAMEAEPRSAGRHPSSARFLAVLRPPPDQSHPPTPPFELDEQDLVWSPSASSSDQPASPATPSRSVPIRDDRPGLSAALADDRRPLVRRKPALDPSLSAASAARTIPPVAVPRYGLSDSGSSGGESFPTAGRFLQSAPVNVPVWPRGGRLRLSGRMGFWEEDGEEKGGEGRRVEDDVMLPPHEIVANSLKGTTFSVFEGAGRTLKGRDLRRVRNAVFQKTGFLD